MAQRDRVAVAVNLRRIVWQASSAQHGRRLAGEGFVDFYNIIVAGADSL